MGRGAMYFTREGGRNRFDTRMTDVQPFVPEIGQHLSASIYIDT